MDDQKTAWIKLGLKVLGFGLATFLGSLQAGGSWQDALLNGGIAALAYLGVGTTTSLEAPGKKIV